VFSKPEASQFVFWPIIICNWAYKDGTEDFFPCIKKDYKKLIPALEENTMG